jgi:transposase
MEIKIMARALSKELREKIVSAYDRGMGTIKEVAEIFDTTSRTVAKYLQIQRKIGDLSPRYSPGRPPILTDTNLDIIKEIILLNRDGTLQDFSDAFLRETGIDVAISTMQNACKKLDMRRKKKFLRTRTRKAGREEKANGLYGFSKRN